MHQNFVENCLVCALHDIELASARDPRLVRNEHVQEAERHLRLLLAEWGDQRRRELNEQMTALFG